ncbi:osmoprotectant transport system ATP-binding protein [Clostridium amylolyticum]|uniref:Quaternary amine transport ATP-binding protein n=1 Tax=Clostridium amylolyticum TaxID=1121298 RepID=A0A1M6GPE1_9CLOT|nr:ABC transporter ATP-binding protein [Clostridium amylolyticum]SHJ11841.1 osmoprotectant transport system ATP-binding protein [Clostridium amylolyticum]
MLELKNVSKKFKNKIILNNINLKINQGELVVLIGPSGCGKTTTLKMINKLVVPTSGELLINGKNISQEDTIQLRRNMGYVIQQTGLFPHMTVGENIGLIPFIQKSHSEEIRKNTVELLKMVDMDPEEYMDRYPAELSGGQQQRIGVARAFATDPDIILMDEPFSALDPITRSQLQDELYNLHHELKKTIVFVTHDMDEALKLGDRICIMKDGDIIQYDTPENILKKPCNEFVEEFVGKNRIWNQPEFIKAKDIMIPNPVKTIGNRTLLQGLEIMKSNKVDSLLIVNKDQQLQGIVTLKYLRMKQEDNLKLSEIMETNFETVSMENSIIDIVNVLNEHHLGYIPVTDNKEKLVGLITKSSLLAVMSNQYIDQEVGV